MTNFLFYLGRTPTMLKACTRAIWATIAQRNKQRPIRFQSRTGVRPATCIRNEERNHNPDGDESKCSRDQRVVRPVHRSQPARSERCQKRTRLLLVFLRAFRVRRPVVVSRPSLGKNNSIRRELWRCRKAAVGQESRFIGRLRRGSRPSPLTFLHFANRLPDDQAESLR